MKDILVIIPAYNEEENILQVVNELREDAPYADILVINDSSKDNTLKILQENNINFLTTPFNLGYAGVIQTGFKYAVLKNYKYVAQFDGDGQHIASELNKLYKTIIDKQVDIVIGSRFLEETDYKHAFFRKIGTKIFQYFIYLGCKKCITDPTSGMQILNERVFSKYAKINNYPDYPDANLLAQMLLEGFEIEEIAVKMRERTAGVSMHAGIWKPIKYMIRMFYSMGIIFIQYRGSNQKKIEGGNNIGC